MAAEKSLSEQSIDVYMVLVRTHQGASDVEWGPFLHWTDAEKCIQMMAQYRTDIYGARIEFRRLGVEPDV